MKDRLKNNDAGILERAKCKISTLASTMCAVVQLIDGTITLRDGRVTLRILQEATRGLHRMVKITAAEDKGQARIAQINTWRV